MKKIFIFCCFSALLFACSQSTSEKSEKSEFVPSAYPEGSASLYDTIVRMDSILFHAYNVCDTVTYASLFSDKLEFYHDKGGLDTSKANSVAAYKRNVCGKVTRELLPGSIEVSPVPNFGAIEIGVHRFHNNQDPPNTPSHYARFIIVWKRDGANWIITRVISLH